MRDTSVTGVILAGGRGTRMGGADKGLLPFEGRPLIEHVIERLRPQVQVLVISANRNIDRYDRYGLSVVRDSSTDDAPEYSGPLAGILAAAIHATTRDICVVPCDMPRIPLSLVTRLRAARQAHGAAACYAHDGRMPQFACVLFATTLRPTLETFLAQGERKMGRWLEFIGATAVDFADEADAFVNINSPTDIPDSQVT